MLGKENPRHRVASVPGAKGNKQEKNQHTATTDPPQGVTALRLALLGNGYLPIPIIGQLKRPALNGWSNLIATEAMIRDWDEQLPNARSTGLLTRITPTIDIDMLDAPAAEALEALVHAHFNSGRLLRRIGKPPKRAFLFRTETPFKKLPTIEFIAPDGSNNHKIEVLCDGQQVVADGIHPDTKQPYTWHGGEPWSVARDALPVLTQTSARAWLDAATAALLARGWQLKDDRPSTTDTGDHITGDELTAEPALIAAALKAIKNNDVDWDKYTRVGLATYHASGSRGEGFEFFDGWAQKSKEKYIGENTAKHWKGYRTSSPKSGFGTLHWLASQDDPGWLRDYDKALMEMQEKAHSPQNLNYWRGRFRLPLREDKPQQEAKQQQQEAKQEEEAASSILHWHGEATTATARPWLVKNLLPETGVALIAGQWGTAKTFVALELAGAVMLSSQTYFIDYRIKRHGGVLFIAAEGAASIPLRLNVMLATKFNPQGPQPFTWADCQPDLLRYGAQGLITLVEEAAAGMRERFNCELALIIIDTVAAGAGWTDESDNAQAQQVMNALNALSAASGALVVGCDHFGKDVSTGTRGASAKEGSADGILTCIGERTLTGKTTNLVLGVRKVKDGEQGREIPYRLEVVNCGVDEDGDHITTCVVRWEPGRDTAGKAGRPPRRRDLFGEALAAALAAAGEMINTPSGVSVRAVRKQVVVMKFKEMYEGKSQNLTETFRKAYKGAQEVYEVKHCTIDGGDWLWPAEEVL